jgi:membrane protein
VQELRDREAAVVAQAEAGVAGRYWSQLTAVDFMNSSLAFAALAVVCGFPFLVVMHAAVGEDVRQAIVTRMGLNAEAARDVNGLISSGREAVSSLTVFGAALLILGAIGMASTLQAWYQKIYGQPPVKGILRHLLYQTAGVIAFSVYIAIDVLVLHAVRVAGAGAVLVFSLTFVFAVLFWWCSAYFLLYGRVGWRPLLPAGVATGFCITGLGVFSSLLFSDQITSGQNTYGPAGVVVAVTSYLIGFGVCLHLGAVFGRMWNDWRYAVTPAARQELAAEPLAGPGQRTTPSDPPRSERPSRRSSETSAASGASIPQQGD